MENTSTIEDRIILYFESTKEKQKDFADNIGVSQQMLSLILKGKSKAGEKIISGLVKNTPVNPYWLLTGEGEILKSNDSTTSAPGISDATAIDYIIEHADRLQKESQKFKMWLEVIALRAKLEAVKEVNEIKKGA